MTMRIATVLSARDWEPDLVAHARETAAVRVVLRAYQPQEIEERADEIDLVVAGGEIAWVTPGRIASWRRLGLGVVGIYPVGDRPAAVMLEAAGSDETLPDDTSMEALVQAIRFLAPAVDQRSLQPNGTIVAVIGPRGAPGCTEAALGHAWNLARRHKTLLIDLDLDAPAVAIRLGLPPRPDITDAADGVRTDGEIPAAAVHAVGKLSVITGSHRVGEPVLRPAMVEDVVSAATAGFERVVLDLGTAAPDDPILKRSDEAILVADGSAVGLVRAARLAAEWSGPPPSLLLNRVDRTDRNQAVEAARTWTGLEPAAIITERRGIRLAALSAQPPDRRFRRALRVDGAIR
jgi:MinD superfamily P-loop ATPase